MLDLSIIIVNYNTCDLLVECLQSVYAALAGLSGEVWVVDNASSDGSVEAVRNRFQSVRLVVNEYNLGYARANNLALAQAQGRICILLNTDTVVQPGAFAAIISAFNTHPKAGMVGPQLLNADRSLQPSHGEFASPWTEAFFQFFLFYLLPSPFPLGSRVHPWQRKSYQNPHLVDWLTGACLAVRHEVAQQVGLLDEGIFMYGEDMEWAWRMSHAGFERWFWPQAQVVHLARQSSQRNLERWITNYTAGNLRFVRRCRSRTSAAVCGGIVFVGSLLRLVLWTMVRLFQPARHVEATQRQLGYLRALRLGLQALWKGEV